MSEWDEFSDLDNPTAQEQTDEWDEFSDSANAPPPEQEGPTPLKSESLWERIRGVDAGSAIAGLAENVLSAATAVPAMMGGGLTELTGHTTNQLYPIELESPEKQEMIRRMDYEEGRPTFRGGRFETTSGVEEGLERGVYQPRTEVGQAINETVGDLVEKADIWVMDRVEEAGDPEKHAPGAAAAYTSLQFAPLYLLPRLLSKGFKSTRQRRGTPSRQTLHDDAQTLYNKADNANVAVNAQSYDGVLAQITDRLAREGYDPGLHPKTASALQNLQSKAGNNQTLMGTEINRKVINGARAATEPADARMAGIMMDVYDDWMQNLGRSDVLFGDPQAAALYVQARDLWRRKMKSDEIEWAIERAGVRADANYSGAAFETALKQEFAAILKNKNRVRMFDANEQAVLRAVVAGTTPQNFLRLLGKMAPRGVISAAPGGLLMGVEPGLGLMTWLVGEGAKRGATAMTSRAANRAAETMRRGN